MADNQVDNSKESSRLRKAPVVPIGNYSLKIVFTRAHVWHNTISFAQVYVRQ